MCRCLSCVAPGCCSAGEGEGAGGAGYEGGEEKRWGDTVLFRFGVTGESSGNGVAGTSDEVYVSGPVLRGFVDIGAGIEVRLTGSTSPFVVGLFSAGAVCPFAFPFVDAIEFLSPYEVLGIPFCICICGPGLLLPFSLVTPFVRLFPLCPPLTDNVLPFLELLWSQLLALDRPFGIELRLGS